MNKRILIVEDDPLVAMMLENALDAPGHDVIGDAGDIVSALARIAAGGFDAAIVDVYLESGLPCDAVAEALAAQSLPFLVATGGFVGRPGPCWDGRPILTKPCTLARLEAALTGLSARSS
ncbi:response regulator [Sphingopyxis sp. KK2]|uniref:response regulator n=1 Tax=Sphingopyxis sp. KK2 TaxID=1855727 RepID=UPI00097E71AA|nr:response regulator [Sphingopyxis sp. KK2]